MKRLRIKGPTLVRSSNIETNSLIVRKSNKRLRKRAKKETPTSHISGLNRRSFMYIGSFD